MMGLLKYAENGREVAHLWSSGHANYSEDETDQKMDNWGSRNPPTCDKIERNCGGTACATCPVKGQGQNPLAIANKIATIALAPAPLVYTRPDLVALVNPKYPWQRNGKQVIRHRSKDETVNEDGEDDGRPKHEVILDYDLFPIDRYLQTGTDHGFSEWVAAVPKRGQVPFVIRNDCFGDLRTLHTALMEAEVVVEIPRLKKVSEYMVAYLRTLQAEAKAHRQYDHFGWTFPADPNVPEPEKFILFGKTIDVTTGKEEPCVMSATTQSAKEFMRKEGSLKEQIDLLEFYNHPNYLSHQFYILCSYASPFFTCTGHAGVIVNATGASGASKSSALATAAAIWGNPVKYVINGTKGGSSPMAREDRAMMLANLPMCVDEITDMTDDDARTFVMTQSQPKGRETLTQDRKLRPHRGGLKSAITLTTANSSLHQIVNTNNTAGEANSVRILEIPFLKEKMVHDKHEADAYMRKISRCYGWIGEELLTKLVPFKAALEERISKISAKLDKAINVQSHERFWSAVASVVEVIGRAASRLGLHPFDMDAVMDWFSNVQIPHMRNLLGSEIDRRNPITVLMDYIEQIHGNTARVELDPKGNIGGIVDVPHVELKAHLDIGSKTLWVRRDPFHRHCVKEGHKYTDVMDALEGSGVITKRNVRKMMADKTTYAKARTWCFVVDLKHKALAGTKK
jgi:hypothetical protein